MEMRPIGSLRASVVGLGCNNFGSRIDAEATDRVVGAALEAGINFFDTADMYGKTQSEVLLGRALGQRRNEVLIATKFGMPIDAQRKGARPEYVLRACEDSLERLGTDRIDLYQIHRPDPEVPIADTLGALDELQRAGKVRELGCSNFSAEQLRAAPRFVSVQNEYSLLHREPEKEVLAECERLKMAFLPYFPLASGVLTGKYRRGEPAPVGTRIAAGWTPTMFTDRKMALVEKLQLFAGERGHSLLELAFAWLLAHAPVASVIAGATTPEQVKANAAAARWRLGAADLDSLHDQLQDA